jgi:hypothetical protein
VNACAVLLGLVLTTAACAGTQSGQAVAGSTTGAPTKETKADDSGGNAKKIGKSVTVTDDDYSAVVTLDSITTVTKGYPPLDTKPKSGTFVILEVSFEGRSGSYPVNPLYFHLMTADGKDIDQGEGSAIFASPENDLGSSELAAGQKVSGRVALDTKLDAGAKIVLLDPLDKVIGEWPL